MIPKGGYRFSEKIMLNQEAPAGIAHATILTFLPTPFATLARLLRFC